MSSLGIITLVISAMAGVMSCGASWLLAPVAPSQGVSKQLASQLYAAKLLPWRVVTSSVSLAAIDQDPKDLIKAATTNPGPGVDDVQIHALCSLKRLQDKRTVPFLLIYAEHMAVYEAGSENATIHGIIHESIAETLSSLTGISITIRGQDPDGLKNGVRQWRRWLADQDIKWDIK